MEENQSFPSPYGILVWFFKGNIYLRAQKFRQELMVNGYAMRRRQKYGKDGKLESIEIIQARKISINLDDFRSEEWQNLMP
jgi:hypothetical protein